ncbi:MAG: hypothetical protein U0176_02935 [Bacteroidia bacterium]
MQADTSATFKEILSVSAGLLQVDRVGVWFLDEDTNGASAIAV